MDQIRDVTATITARADRDAEFREALVAEAIECLRNGEADIVKAIFREHIAPAGRDGAG